MRAQVNAVTNTVAAVLRIVDEYEQYATAIADANADWITGGQSNPSLKVNT